MTSIRFAAEYDFSFFSFTKFFGKAFRGLAANA